jgi:peptidoglycan/xylan/chitin deacetylase (PgdA/CDA1 family)
MRSSALLFLVALAACSNGGATAPGPSGAPGADGVPAVAVNGTCVRDLTVDARDSSSMPNKTLALTFDDGPSEFSNDLLQLLADNHIAAGFFINGKNVPGLESVLDREVGDGHMIGNHTQTHASLPSLSADQIVDEVAETDPYLSRIPQDRLLLRPPYGDWDDSVTSALQASPMKKYFGPVDWDIGGEITDSSAADWACWDGSEGGTRTVEQCGDLYMAEIQQQGKGIVLMHDGPPGGNGDKTVAMVRYLLPKLKAAGYSFERVDQVFFPSAPAAQTSSSAGAGAAGAPGAAGAAGGATGANAGAGAGAAGTGCK